MSRLRFCLLFLFIGTAFSGFLPANGKQAAPATGKKPAPEKAVNRPDTAITLLIELQGPAAPYSLEPAPLRYDKDFAWSFTLDDGYVSAWLVAFPYFSGGRVAPAYKDQWGADQGADGNEYPGLFFSDGCGGKIPFTAAIAINAKSIVTTDSFPQPGHLSWKQVNALYRGGWDIFNHAYSHAVGAQVDADGEVAMNNQLVLERTGCKMTQFVVPGGKDDTISEGPYTKAAFAAGLNAVHCGHFPGYRTTVGNDMSLRKVLAGRRFLSTKTLKDPTAGITDIERIIRTGEKPWFNVFTHSVGRDDLWGISLCFDDFRAYFDLLERTYGLHGRDNAWVASYQAVQEYLLIRQSLAYSVRRKGNFLTVRMHTGKLPDGLRNKCLTFVLKADQRIRNVSCEHCMVESYSPTGRQLINLKW